MHPDGVALVQLGARQHPPRLLNTHFESCAPQDRPAVLRQTVRALHLNGAPCVCVLAPGMAGVLRVEAPDVPPDEIRAAVRWRVKDMLEFHVDDAVLDVFDVPGQKVRGPGRVMYVVAARRALVEAQIEAVHGAGLQLTAIDIPEMAQRNVAAALPDDAGGVAMLSLGARAGLITLTQGGTLYLARSLEFGYADLNAAERGTAAREQLVLEVQRSLDYYESHFSQPPIGSSVLAPTEEAVDGLAEAMGDGLAVPVRGLALDELVAADQAPPARDQARCLAALGGALRSEARVL
ncbi:pilus assembly protein PilM [Ectothiorhodospiraceae bacterium 2226]|nr:pilus assembly protein PilM [Ectothiorhodospiraceae bacterium 2226]